MGSSKPFSRNPSRAAISGVTNLGDIAIGTSAQNYSAGPGGLTWWMGPDESTGYVIGAPVSEENQSTPIGLVGNVQFWKTDSLSDSAFLSLANYVKRTFGGAADLATAADANVWLVANNYYTNWTLPATTTTTTVAAPTPILYYDPSNSSSYLGTGTTITDLSGNSRNGAMSNISFTSPYFTYNGSSSQVSIADNALLEPGSGSFTMEVWVNQAASGNDVVLGKFNNGGVAQNVSYSIRTTGTTFYAQLGSGSGSGSTLFVNSTNHVGTLNTWYQLVYVFKNGATKTLETFVNGSSIGTVNHSLPSILNSTNSLYLGSYNGGEYSQWFDGKIGVVRLYMNALTSSNVLTNYNSTKSTYGL